MEADAGRSRMREGHVESPGWASASACPLPGRAPSRPLLRLALALSLGCAWGNFAAPPREGLLLCASALSAAWLSWRISASALHVAPRPNASLGAILLSLVVVLGALRATPHPALRWDAQIEAWEGEWRPQRETQSNVRGTLARAGPQQARFELPRGSARAGETIRIQRGAPPAPMARGPVPRSRLGAVGTLGWLGDPADETLATEIDRPTALGALIRAEADEVLRLETPVDRSAWLTGWATSLERSTRRIEDPHAAALARAFLLGDASALDAASADLFARNGLLHVLAVSGWHVAMMAWMIVRPFTALATLLAARLPRWRRVLDWSSMLLCVALCMAYVPLTGGGAPVRRSAIAVALAATAAFWPRGRCDLGLECRRSRRIDALSLWSAALIVECWLNPGAPAEVGVQLSYAATLGLILGTGALSELLGEWTGCVRGARPRDFLDSWPRQCASALARRGMRLILGGVAASVAAVAATAPIIWLSFGEACAWGVLTTPLLSPLFVLLFISGILLLALPLDALATLFSAASHALLTALRVFDGLPGTPTLLPSRPTWLLWGTLAAAWLLLRRRRSPGRARCGLQGCTALGAAALLLPWSPAAADFELHLLDVGHGTACVFRAPGEPCWIFDCGSRDRAGVVHEALAPLLRTWEVTAPKVVLSHADNDHCAGFRWVVERTPPRLWVGAVPAPLAERLAHTCERLDLSQGRMQLPDAALDLSLALLRGLPLEGNEGSRSLWLTWRSRTILLCGDAVDDGWAPLLREGLLASRGGTLVAPHHGSDGRRLGALLDSFAPGLVWISGSGQPPLAAELERRGVPWASTSLSGPLRWPPPGASRLEEAPQDPRAWHESR